MASEFAAQLSCHVNVSRWIIAHSGGLDSQVLLHLAAKLIPANKLLVLHIHHGLQSSADYWAEFSIQQSCSLNLPHQLIHATLDGRSENAARDARYQAFSEVLQPDDVLLMAHHANDQAETLLFRLLRGTGLSGLSGIPRHRTMDTGRLMRPLLSFTRQQLEVWAHEHNLEWVEDPTNQIGEYDRNYLRLEVMPLLERRWPGFVKRWSATSQLLADDNELLKTYLEADLIRCIGSRGELKLTLLPDKKDKRFWPLIRLWCQRSGLVLSRRQQAQFEKQLLDAKNDAQPCLTIGELCLRRYRRSLYLMRIPVASRLDCITDLQVGSTEMLDGQLEILSGSGLSTLDGVSLVRRKGGERLRPLGRGGSCSLKKLFQEQGVPPWMREFWPLLMIENEIVAVPGICICEGWWTEKGGFTVNWSPL